MKRILITGATSWIGSEVEAHLAAFPGMYGVERVSLRGDAWKDRSWEGFDSVVHLAAVVHESGKAGGMGGLYDESTSRWSVKLPSRRRPRACPISRS